MSGPPTNLPVTIMSAGLPVALSLSDDNKSIVGMVPPRVFPALPRMTWIVLSSDDVTFTIKSFANKQSIGFDGALAPGANIVTSNPSDAPSWVFQREPDSDYYTISLPGPSYVIGMPDPRPGAQAQLMEETDEPQLNQLWRFIPAGF